MATKTDTHQKVTFTMINIVLHLVVVFCTAMMVNMAAAQTIEQTQQPPREPNVRQTNQAAAAPSTIELSELQGPFKGTRFLEHVEFLAADELQGRYPGTEGSRKAAAYIIEQYQHNSLQPLGDNGTFVQEFPWKDKSGCNLIAFFPGAGDLAEQAIIVCAHYDHLGSDEELEQRGQDGIYNGADDNASGVAALLLIAEAIGAGDLTSGSSRRSAVFITFDCEERGMAGSRYYCQHPLWALNKTVAAINLDMVGRLRSRQVYASDIASSPFIANKLERIATSHNLLTHTQISGFATDHRTFLNNGIPAFNLSTGTHSDCHQVSDETEKINQIGGVHVARLTHSLLEELVSSAEPIPFEQSHSQFDINLLLRIARGLGIVTSLASTDEGYAEIVEVLPDSAAAKAGVQPGDQITGLNEHAFERIEDILMVWAKLDLSLGLKLSLLRGDKKIVATIPADAFYDLIERQFTKQPHSQPKTEPPVTNATQVVVREPTSLPEFKVDGVPSYYMYANRKTGSKKGLPAIIFLGHPEGKRENHQRFAGRFSEPVLLIWCDLFLGIAYDTCLDDAALWHEKRKEFVKLYGRYKEYFGFDSKRVYLTGFSFSGAYSLMLAYDRPDLYTGVVAMSAVSYPEQIQKALKSSESVITVVVRGEKDTGLIKRQAQEEATGHLIESNNSHSRFVVKPGEDHGSVVKYWEEYLDYILRFKAVSE